MSLALRITTAIALVSLVLVFVVGAIGMRKWSDATDGNCERISRIVDAGAGVIGSGRVMIDEAYRDGAISQRQRDEALERIRAQLALWNSADCDPSDQ